MMVGNIVKSGNENAKNYLKCWSKIAIINVKLIKRDYTLSDACTKSTSERELGVQYAGIYCIGHS